MHAVSKQMYSFALDEKYNTMFVLIFLLIG